MRTWLGPAPEEVPLRLGPIRLERWQRQPRRTLLHGALRDKAEEKKGIGSAFSATLLVSKGHPSPQADADADALCAGVRCSGSEQQSAWYCPCDVRVVLVGERCADHSKTVRWVLTPQNNEIFFGVLPLAEVEQRFVSGAGTVRVKVELHFHMSSASRDSLPSLLPFGAHGSVMRALMHAWCLVGPDAHKDADKAQVGGARHELCRGGLLDKRPGHPPFRDARQRPPAAGLLPPCSVLPSAFAQEIVPGLMIASEEVMSGQTRLVELHDVGVGSLLEVASRPICGAPTFAVRLLQLRGCGDMVELVEDPACPAEEPQSAKMVICLIEDAHGRVLTGQDGTWHALVLPREAGDMEPCAALVAAVVARKFQLSFGEAQSYVRTRWDVAIGPAWAERLAECGLLPGPAAGAPQPPPRRAAAAGQELQEAHQAFERGDPDGVLPSRLASWFASACTSRACLQAALAWEESWEPCPGDCLRVHDSGWGAASEVFRAALANGVALCSGLVTLRMMAPLPQGELFQVPYCVEVGEDSWHLVALVCSDSEEGPQSCSGRRRIVAFLRGAGELLLDADGGTYGLVRNPLAGSAPDHWLCTCDMAPRAAVFSRGRPASTRLPPPVPPARTEAAARPSASGGEVPRLDAAVHASGDIIVRIVTEKMLQQADGGLFDGGAGVAASAVLRVAPGAGLPELQEQVHQSLRIPPQRQLLLHLPDKFPHTGGQQLFPVRAPLVAMAGDGQSVTLLLLFSSEAAEAEAAHSTIVVDGARPPSSPLQVLRAPHAPPGRLGRPRRRTRGCAARAPSVALEACGRSGGRHWRRSGAGRPTRGLRGFGLPRCGRLASRGPHAHRLALGGAASRVWLHAHLRGHFVRPGGAPAAPGLRGLGQRRPRGGPRTPGSAPAAHRSAGLRPLRGRLPCTAPCREEGQPTHGRGARRLERLATGPLRELQHRHRVGHCFQRRWVQQHHRLPHPAAGPHGSSG